jgi:hypothetical protein
MIRVFGHARPRPIQRFLEMAIIWGPPKLCWLLQSSFVQYNNYSLNLLEKYIKPVGTNINIRETKRKHVHLDRLQVIYP